MKRFLLPLLLLFPLSADTHEIFHTRRSMECMKQRECTFGVNELTSEEKPEEVKVILENLNEMGVKVYRAIPQYFIDEYRGLYYSDKNSLYLNSRYTSDDESLLKVLRHEGWHAAQDCMAGTIANSDLAIILDHKVIPSHIIDETFMRYGVTDPTVIRIEREAVWAMYEPNMTIKALEACNSDVPMWETYFPPKRTWSYLYWNGYIK